MWERSTADTLLRKRFALTKKACGELYERCGKSVTSGAVQFEEEAEVGLLLLSAQ